MGDPQEQDVLDCLVVGAGPVGLAMANGLARHGLRCRIVDRAAEPTSTAKAAGVWSRTVEVLHTLGLAERFVEAGVHAHGASIFAEGKRLAHIHLSGIESPYNFALMLPQSRSEEFLREGLSRHGIQVERPVEFLDFSDDGGGVDCRLRHPDGALEEVRCRWLLGCDGAHSTVRHALDLEFRGQPDPNWWMVGDLDIHGPVPEDEVSVYWHEEGVIALFPMGSRYFRFAAEAGPAGEETSRPDPTLEEIQALLDRRGPGGLTATHPRALGYFRIHERQVSSYRAGRVFLAGDAAHVHSPLGGQGMNTGIQDTHNLAWKLALVTRGRAGEGLLDTYDAERRPVAAGVIRGTSLGTRVLSIRSHAAQALRNRVFSIVASLPVVQHRVRSVASELDVNYRKSPLSRECPRGIPAVWRLGGGVAPGDRAPDAGVFRPGVDGEVRLFDLLAEPRFSLLVLGGAAEEEVPWPLLVDLAHWAEDTWPGLVTGHVVVPGGEVPPGCEGARSLLLDTTTEMHQEYGATQDSLYLVRPDGYVAWRSQAPSREGLQEYLRFALLQQVLPAGG